MKKVLKEILSTSLYLLIVLCLTYVVIHFVGQRTQVIGGSMETTLSENDNLIVDKLTYRFREPRRFDIVVFPFQYEKDTYYIKRIIGLPGETIFIDGEGNIFINDELLEESYGKEIIKDAGRAYEPITLGEDEYFVMGDNRNNSHDSRFWKNHFVARDDNRNNSQDSRDPSVGNIARDDIIGRAWIRIWPLNKFGILKHQ